MMLMLMLMLSLLQNVQSSSGAWGCPLTSVWCWCYEWMELWLHTPYMPSWHAEGTTLSSPHHLWVGYVIFEKNHRSLIWGSMQNMGCVMMHYLKSCASSSQVPGGGTYDGLVLGEELGKGREPEVLQKNKRWWNISLRNFQNAIEITVMPEL